MWIFNDLTTHCDPKTTLNTKRTGHDKKKNCVDEKAHVVFRSLNFYDCKNGMELKVMVLMRRCAGCGNLYAMKMIVAYRDMDCYVKDSVIGQYWVALKWKKSGFYDFGVLIDFGTLQILNWL